MKTYVPKAGELQREWYVVDATGQSLGRLAVEVAKVLRGKHKATFTPNADTGDFVVVVNADRILLTGNKSEEPLYRHSGYPGGLKEISRGQLLEKSSSRLVERTIKGMLPHNKLGAEMYRKLKVYAGANHPHTAQQPQPLAIGRKAQLSRNG